MATQSILDALQCPRCQQPITIGTAELVCGACGQRYPRVGEIPILLSDPEKFLFSCRQQIASLEQQTAQTIAAIRDQLLPDDVLPSTKARCQSMIEAVQGQVEDIRCVLDPMVGLDPSTAMRTPERKPPSFLTYIHYLYRDWGWPEEPDGENERIFAAVRSVLSSQPLGRMLVLGAGACRLAYDLHRSDQAAETVALDIDPLVFTAANTVVRGGIVRLREANAEIHLVDSVVKEWILKAPHGPIVMDQFNFLFADALSPPFAAEAFDTVLTPWFIDIVPLDLRNMISEVHRLLKPGGRWLNVGPLHYRPEVPVTRRFAREELFDLLGRAGFQMDSWRAETMPYLVSKLNGRGKVEWVLSFSATKLKAPSISQSSAVPPPWLLFPHIPIPLFAGLSAFRSEDPAEQIVASAIDGKKTMDDIASLLASAAGETGLSRDQYREIVRRCLIEILNFWNP